MQEQMNMLKVEKIPGYTEIQENIEELQTTISGVTSDLSEKVDKVIPETDGNLAALDNSGNLVDTQHKTSDFAQVIQQINILDEGSALTITLSANTVYTFEERISDLEILLDTPTSGIANIYHFFITIGETVPNITFPTGITWNGGNEPTPSANAIIEVSIMNNIGLFVTLV